MCSRLYRFPLFDISSVKVSCRKIQSAGTLFIIIFFIRRKKSFKILNNRIFLSKDNFYTDKQHGFISPMKNVIITNIYTYHIWHHWLCNDVTPDAKWYGPLDGPCSVVRFPNHNGETANPGIMSCDVGMVIYRGKSPEVFLKPFNKGP